MKFYFMLCMFFLLSISIFPKDKNGLNVGDNAPDFTLKDAHGKSYTLSDYQGKSPVVVYFYPKAGTAGCTKEACGIRDDKDKFKENNIEVLGISVDPAEDIKKFIADYHLNFPLLSDSKKDVSKEYGVLLDSGVDKRVTFIIDKKGKIAKIINVTDIASHAAQVFNDAKKLN
jgi:thioredoxin-dependent peroxiredoxin